MPVYDFDPTAVPSTQLMLKVGLSPMQIEALQTGEFVSPNRRYRHAFASYQWKALAAAEAAADEDAAMPILLRQGKLTRHQARMVALLLHPAV